jgi:hypothetical protein
MYAKSLQAYFLVTFAFAVFSITLFVRFLAG